MFNLYSKTQSELKNRVSQYYRIDEKTNVNELLSIFTLSQDDENKALEIATDLIKKVRSERVKGNGVDALMQEFKLSTEEGIALMCLAESLLRIPDNETKDKLIRDKIAKGNWKSHTKTESFFVNATSWGLLITGKLVKSLTDDKMSSVLMKTIAKGGEPLIRKAVVTAVGFMGNQFVMGETIDSALKVAVKKEAKGYKFSYDMLGEAALTDEDAMKYMQSYTDALHAIGKANHGRGVHNGPGISVKLSAIHPRYQRSQHHRVVTELYPRIKQLCLLAKEYQLGLFIDAEETDRLEISLELLEKLLNDKDLQGFNGLGFVIQAYQRRALAVVDYVIDLAIRYNHQLMVRLVKGAYWDSEIKKAQVDGQDDYPVYTRKFYTDLSYLVCAQRLLANQEQIYPLFATHNAHTVATIYQLGLGKEYEFQCLHGMGETLYDKIVGRNNLNVSCRVYAPVGTYDTLLAYLVRRLLENGANSSFVHQLVDKNIPIEDLLASPVTLSKKSQGESNPYFEKPPFIYPNNRVNSKGLDLSDEITLSKLQLELNQLSSRHYLAYPLILDVSKPDRDAQAVISPANKCDKVGGVIKATADEVDIAVKNAVAGFKSWSKVSPEKRAAILLKMADLMEENYFELLSILVREAGKTLNNAISEVREAVDFCRYYANQVINEFDNVTHKPIGVMVCISPWNFPLAIFLGEISSCLVSGNSVIAKPSFQTNLIAFYAVELLYKAGVPTNVVQLTPGSGSVIGNQLTKDPRVAGVIFTGSTEVAQMINQNLAAKDAKSVLIAETGGQNTMIVDSSSLPEQVVTDVITSAFDSAGQRCSALRVLYIQADIADKVIHMLRGAMDELRVGDPTNLATDVGPVIDVSSQKTLLEHIETMKHQARMFYQAPLTSECNNGIFVPPTLIEIGNIKELKREMFGPIVHVIRFAAHDFDNIITEINSSGYGLTQGLHSRIEETAYKVYNNIKAGNIYVNRNMVGAVVGVQPFGGEGMSGTGPKAGGSFYLYSLVDTKSSPKQAIIKRECNFAELELFVAKMAKYGFSTEEEQQLSKYANYVTEHSPLAQQIELPGPTGERNFMFFARRGTVACFANNSFGYAFQIICALATGNKVILPTTDATKVFTGILNNTITYHDNLVAAPELNAALISKDYVSVNQLRKDLALRNGCLVINVDEKDNNWYSLHALTTERTVSINITATGGNVQLMSIHDIVK